MNLSNKLTLSRLLLAFVFMTVLSVSGLIAKIVALVIFVLASFTDMLDGWFARKRGEVTDLGRILDPIADKVLVLAAFLSFVGMRIVYPWMVVVIIIRELLITGLRIFALTKGRIVEAAALGKHKTVSQMFTIFFILVSLIIKEIGPTHLFGRYRVQQITDMTTLLLMIITVGLTVSSGFLYLWSNRKIIKSL